MLFKFYFRNSIFNLDSRFFYLFILCAVVYMPGCYRYPQHYKVEAFDKSLEIGKSNLALVLTYKSKYLGAVKINSVDGASRYKCGSWNADCELYLLPGKHTLNIDVMGKLTKYDILSNNSKHVFTAKKNITFTHLFSPGSKYKLYPSVKWIDHEHSELKKYSNIDFIIKKIN